MNVIISDDTMGNFPQLVQLARIVRLIRVLRIARVVRFVAGLKIMIVSILSTLKALGWALILLLIIIYCYGIVLAGAVTSHFEALTADDENIPNKDKLEKYWGSLRAAMYTLFMSISGGLSWIDAVMPLGEVGWIWGAIFTSFISFAYFAVLNVMTGVFCQSALDTAAKNQDLKWHGMLQNKQHFVEKIQSFFMQIDRNNSGQLDYKQMVKAWDSQDMQSFFASLDIEPDDAWMFFQILDTDGETGVSMDEFVEGCMRLKGQAKAFDVAVMTYHQKHLGKQLVDFMNEVQARLRYSNGTVAESNATLRNTAIPSQSLNLTSRSVDASRSVDKDSPIVSPFVSETACTPRCS